MFGQFSVRIALTGVRSGGKKKCCGGLTRTSQEEFVKTLTKIKAASCAILVSD
jgi:hypothetical protein